MPRQFENRVKIYQIIESQLPKFIRDNVLTVQQNIESISGSGTYVRNGKLVTVTSINHGLEVTDRIKVEYISGSGVNGFYFVKDVINSNTFTLDDEVSGRTSGTVNYEQYATVIGLEQPNLRSVAGNYDKFIEFLRQYYISQEFPSSAYDLIDNLDQYLRFDNLTPEVIIGQTILTQSIVSSSTVINVESTKGFPEKYGLLKIDDEIITYTEKTTTSFLGCIRGFSGITNYHQDNNPEELVFSESDSSSHEEDSIVENLSVLFLKEFFKKIKYSLVPGLEDRDFIENLNVGNFIKEARSLYECKGTEESFRILFNVLYGITPKVIDLERFLIKPSDARFLRREVSVVEAISGNPLNLKGKTIFKNNDESTYASVSEVEPITKGGKVYYKLFLFVGYEDFSSSIVGNFSITPSTKASSKNLISKTSSEVVTVDSTIGFQENGYFIYNNKKVFYSEKSINQFFNCYTDSESSFYIEKQNVLMTPDFYYGYEDDNQTKKVELRVTGVVSKLNFGDDLDSEFFNYIEGDEIFVKNLGEIIENPLNSSKTRKEILANTWIYNTNCRFQIDSLSISGSQFSVISHLDKSSLDVGDYIEFLERNTELVVEGLENIEITNITGKTIVVNSSLSPLLSTENYDIRRIQKTSSVSTSDISLKYGNNKILANILNVYNDNDTNLFVASNSLPSYPINPDVQLYEVYGILEESYNPDTQKYSILEFNEIVSFLTGERIYYKFSDSPIEFLEEKDYFVEVLEDKRKIRLYSSLSLIGSEDYLEFSNITGTLPEGTHTFISFQQRQLEISPQKILKKIPIRPRIDEQKENEVISGPIGMLVNGVEILGYKTTDKIYYGPIENVNVLNSGTGYDVLNPPILQLSSGTSKIQPVVSGSVEKVYVDLQTFDIDVNVSVAITGGNGSGALFEPVIVPFQREMDFDARQISDGGGIDFDIETISFISPHGLVDGQPISYSSNNNDELGIGTYLGQNLDSGKTLVNNGEYYAKVFNDVTIQLYPSLSDFSAGINTIGITSIGNRGIHKFKTLKTNRLKEILVLNGGSGYTNRKLRVKSSGISTSDYSINFINHGFSDGDLIEYSYENSISESSSIIVGLSSSLKYNVLKINDNKFRLCNAGIGGTDISNYNRKNYVKFETSGSGYQIFKYPDISLLVSYSSPGIGSTGILGTINATPIVRGSIEDVYVYESGSNYGSKILNLESTPKVNIKNGNSAQFKPIIVNGSIVDVQVQYGGVDYYSYPDVVVVGDGFGAILRPIIENNRISDVIVIDSGSGYTEENTSIIPVSAGKNAKFDVNLRSLTINGAYKSGRFIETSTPNSFYRTSSDEVVSSSLDDTLQYYILSYSSNIASKFNDDSSKHSPIIGWAYDGNPIYGPYGYSDPDDKDSEIRALQPGYTNNVIENRPDGFDQGFFIEDYIFNNSGDLDEYNGRFCKTPEFPNGVYAYFATIQNNPYDFNSFIGVFPYFIGNYYRSDFNQLENLLLNQNFDFNSSNLIRNTLPYKVNDLYANNDFIIESYKNQKQKVLIESIVPGEVSGFDIISSGENYKVSDRVLFEEGSNESNLVAKVSEVVGKEIESLTTEVNTYSDSLLTWVDSGKIKVTITPYHDLENNDRIIISDVSDSLSRVSKQYRIGVTTYVSNLVFDMGSPGTTGLVTDIVLTNVPKQVSVGSSIKIENEIFSVLGVYKNLNTLRVLRTNAGASHTSFPEVYFFPDSFIINENNVQNFESSINNKVYFNPTKSVGVGITPGIAHSIEDYYIGVTKVNDSVPTQSIYIPNHPFKNNQKVILTKNSSDSPISVAISTDGTPFNLPLSGDSQEVYIINKSSDYIGIVTSLSGIATSTYYKNGLFFVNNGSDSNLYSIESQFTQEKCKSQRFKTTIYTKEPHLLTEKDKIKLSLNTSSTVGFTTFTLKYIERNNLLIVDERYFSNSGVNTSTNTIFLTSHGYLTGEKVYYRSSDYYPEGLNEGSYFVYKVDDNNFKLTKTLSDSLLETPIVIGIGTSGGIGQSISKVNSNLKIIKNNNVVFDLSDSSLFGYNFKLFYDNKFKKEFTSIETSDQFILSGVGTIGVSSTASVTLSYFENIPTDLFYSIEKDGLVLKPDDEVKNFSNISFVNSDYFGEFEVYNVGIASTAFNISLKKRPESLSYTKTDCDTLEYTTTSLTAKGGINKLIILNKSSEYKRIPIFSNIESEEGFGAYLVPKSDKIGNPKESRIVVNGFDYASDRTLRPDASLPSLCTIKNSQQIDEVQILNSGNNYVSSPDLIVINPETNEIIEDGILRANLSGSSIGSINVEVSPKGLPPTPVTIKVVNNTNGISISQVQSSSSGIVTCILTTPLSGFGTDPFTVGDKIFVEGIVKDSVFGTGFNSSDYDYQFFTVTNYYSGSNPGKLEYNLSSLTINPGVAKTIQDSFASIIKEQNYPLFKSIQSSTTFFVGENIYSDKGSGFELRDLIVKNSTDTFIRLIGTYELEVGEIIKGEESFNIATIDSIKKPSGRFEINSFTSSNLGWSDDTGKIGNSFQVIPDNDYYQNLSYTVKSTKTWSEIVSPVNSLLHTSGLKNFSDTEIIQKVNVGVGTTSNLESIVVITRDFISESRIDTINNFDLVIDVDIS